MRPLLLLIVGALTLPNAAANDSNLCFEDWTRQQLDRAMAERGGAGAMQPLRLLDSLRTTAADPRQIDLALDKIRAANGTDPLVAGEIDAMLLWRTLSDTPAEEARQRAQRLGLVTQFLITSASAAERLSPETYSALNSETAEGWRAIETMPLGTLPLDAMVTPAQKVRAGAVTYLHATRGVDLALRFGSDDRVRCNLDGAPLLDETERHDSGFDQTALFLHLDAGWHRLAFEIDQEDGSWGLTLRLTDLAGGPVELRGTVPAPSQRVLAEKEIAARNKPAFKSLRNGRTLTGELEAAARSRAPLAEAALALDLAARRIPSRVSTRVVDLIRDAAQRAPGDAAVQSIRAVLDTDPSRRREAMEAGIALAPTDPSLLRGLIQYRRAFGQDRQALEWIAKARAACPSDPFLEMQEIVAKNGDGFGGGVVAGLTALAQRTTTSPELYRALARAARNEGLPRRARAALEQALALEPKDDRARGALIALLTEQGEVDLALQRLDEAIAQFPLLPQWREQRAVLLQRVGRQTESLRELDAALTTSPGNPRLTVLRGELLLALGRKPDAAEAFKAARPYFGEEGALDQRIAALTGKQAGFGSEWTVPIEAALALEKERKFAGDPPYVVLSKTDAWHVNANGIAEQFEQRIIRVLKPDQADGTKTHSITYVPSLERAAIVEARLIRSDGTVIPAQRGEQPVLPDPEVRMWYDSRALGAAFPRFEVGDLLEVRYLISERGPSNPITDGYFGDMTVLGEEVPVLSSRLVLDFDSRRPVNYRLVNLTVQETTKQETRDGRRLIQIEFPSLPAFTLEPNSPPAIEQLPYAVVGTASSWNDLGRAYAHLIQDSMALDADVKQVVKSTTAHTAGRRQTVRALYDWVIENTRYVALEFGIHAIKPYSCSLVFRRRHGDCKDKATLLVAMLKEAGIKADVALVRTSDRGKIDTTIPVYSAFDHAIVFVPGEDLWLDGTVLHHGLDDLPMGDRGIQALIVNTDGAGSGLLTETPTPAPENDSVVRREEIRLDSDGAATVSADITARGESAARERSYFRRADQPGKVLQSLLRDRWPDLSVIDAAFPRVGLDDPDANFSYRARVSRFAQSSGTQISSPLSFSVVGLPLDPPAAGRRSPVELPPAFEQRLQSAFTFPAGSKTVELPREGLIESPWGRVELRITRDNIGLEAKVSVNFRGGLVALDKAAEFAAFVEQSRQLLGQKIVLEVPR